MSRPLWHLTESRHLGRRGRCLLAFATLDLGYAWVMISASPHTVNTSNVFRWFSEIVPMTTWAVLWGTVGLICLYHAFHRYDRFGFIAAIGIKVLWGLIAFTGWMLDGVSPLYVAIWPGLAWLVWTIAGWPEPEQPGKDSA